MKLTYTEPFKQDFQTLPPGIQRRVEKTIKLLIANPRHPSLQIHKMEPKERKIFEARVSKNYRLTFNIGSGELIFRRVGTHGILRKP